MYFNPLEQFDIIYIYCIYPVTNLNVLFFIQLCTLFYVCHLSTVIPKFNLISNFIESLLDFVKSVLVGNIGYTKNLKIFPIYFFVFLIVLISNLLGMIPYSITLTSNFIVIFFVSIIMFLSINIIGIIQNKAKVLCLFLPKGVPVPMFPFVIIIEFISYFARLFSLAIRVFANVLAGHILLKILVGFSWKTLTYGLIKKFGIYYIFMSLCLWILIILVTLVELVIAMVQAYVFLTLISIYYNDITNLH